MRMRSATLARMLRACETPATKLTGIDAVATSETVRSTRSAVVDAAYVAATAAMQIDQATNAMGMRNATARAGTLPRTQPTSRRPAITRMRAAPMTRYPVSMTA